MTFTPSKKELTMGTDKLSRQAFEAWLKIDKNKTALKKIAGETYKTMKMNRLNLPGMDIRLITTVGTHQIAPYEDISQELMIFLLENEKVRNDLVAGCPIIMKRLQNFLWKRMLDITRSAEANQDIYKDTWRLFYRHIQDVLGKSDQFVKTKISPREIVFGRTHEPPRAVVMMEDLKDIGYPPNIPANFQALNTKKNILRLAEYFWEQAAQKIQEPNFQFNVRDFMLWIGEYVKLSNRIDSYPENSNDETPDNPLAKASKDPEDVMKKKYLAAWANNFYHLLKDIEKEIFYYYECKGLRHKDVAELMDKKGNLSYQRDKITDSLKAFLRPLDWVSPDNGRKQNDPADFIFFRDNLCSLLSSAIEGV